MNQLRAVLLLSLASPLSGCGGVVEGASASPTPPGSDSSLSATRPSQCTSVPTLFVEGAPASVATSVVTSTSNNVTWNAVDMMVKDVATDGATLYWTLSGATDGAIVSAPIAAGRAPVLLVDEIGEGLPSHLSVQGSRLFWLEASAADPTQARVMSANIDGSKVHPLSGFEPIQEVAFDASAAYVAAGTTIARTDAASGVATTLVEGVWAHTLAVDATNLYFLSDSVAGRVPKGGGASTTFAHIPSAGPIASVTPYGGIVSDRSEVYWALSGATPQVLSMPTTGGTAAQLAAIGAGTATFLQLHGSWLYFTSSGESSQGIYRLLTAGSTPSLVVALAYGPDLATEYPPGYNGTTSSGRVALDASNVYWGAFGSALMPAIFCVAQ